MLQAVFQVAEIYVFKPPYSYRCSCKVQVWKFKFPQIHLYIRQLIFKKLKFMGNNCFPVLMLGQIFPRHYLKYFWNNTYSSTTYICLWYEQQSNTIHLISTEYFILLVMWTFILLDFNCEYKTLLVSNAKSETNCCFIFTWVWYIYHENATVFHYATLCFITRDVVNYSNQHAQN